MTEEQEASLLLLRFALKLATANGLFDELAAHIHPDTINTFCDAIEEVAIETGRP